MRRAHARNTARCDLSTLADEAHQHADVLIVDVVDLVHAEAAQFFAPEILLLAGNRFVAAGGTHRSADRPSAFLFGHGLFLLSGSSRFDGLPGDCMLGRGCRGRGRWRRWGRNLRRWTTGGALFALLF